MPTLYMETTKIPASRTAAEIQTFLGGVGANSITTSYGTNPWGERTISSLKFSLRIGTEETYFALPIRVAPIHDKLLKKLAPRNRAKKERDVYEQAERVAWRQILRWIESQIALIDTGMVAAGEVFLPYALAVDQHGRHQPFTLYEAMVSTGKLLAAPAKS